MYPPVGTIQIGTEVSKPIKPGEGGSGVVDDAYYRVPITGAPLPVQLASWIDEEDHQYGVLAMFSAYEFPHPLIVGDWNIHQWSYSRSVSVYRRPLVYFETAYCVVCKGTSPPWEKDGWKDVLDDFILGSSFTDLMKRWMGYKTAIVTEALEVIRKLIEQEGAKPENISLTGHSLGGFAAFEVGYLLKLRCYGWNAAAPPTIVARAPGPSLATHYHIYGDMISVNMRDVYAKCTRAMFPDREKSDIQTFGRTPYWHATDRFLAENEPPRDFASYLYETTNCLLYFASFAPV